MTIYVRVAYADGAGRVYGAALKILNIFDTSVTETLDFDTEENRAMATFPKKFAPETFTSDVETWYNDNLPFRLVIYTSYKNSLEAFESPYTQAASTIISR